MKNKIRYYRQEMKITQKELGKILGVSRQTISALENNKFNPTILMVHKLTVLFNCKIDDLFTFDEKYKYDPDKKTLEEITEE
ncbi:helix-turn-helix transcriptional regulator [Methanobrevibacter sp. TMH8]|uniref:helix-turn-helix transcriptional regulator n=1 Tax=Methanobrevibacter sp. TMH8 TaxID=2848611 RepID=UPI001CCFE5E0|nr:helix-turn-helix transcriptional regulator [Methanobrevibacter sp. TMH8]MBZ9570727.1 helix-turn-helix transcriptional regulator [Methanobrevibacter sp. TMH8]